MLVTAVTALITAYGFYVLKNLPVDVFPDLNKPTVTVGASEILVDEGRRFILSPFTTDSFSSALKDLILSKELREDIGRVNSRAVSFSLEQQRSKLNVILNKMENIY
jgi:glycosyltransferase involved in cell wall biosynthesis